MSYSKGPSSYYCLLYYRQGLVDNGIVEHSQNLTTSNYNAIANSHVLQFTTAYTKSLQSVVPSTMDAPLLLGSHPRGLVVISHQL
jgi:hypothetical protein